MVGLVWQTGWKKNYTWFLTWMDVTSKNIDSFRSYMERYCVQLCISANLFLFYTFSKYRYQWNECRLYNALEEINCADWAPSNSWNIRHTQEFIEQIRKITIEIRDGVPQPKRESDETAEKKTKINKYYLQSKKKRRKIRTNTHTQFNRRSRSTCGSA